MFIQHVTGLAKINHVSAKHHRFFHICFIITYQLFILTNGLYSEIKKFDTTFKVEGISENITRCNLHSHAIAMNAVDFYIVWSHMFSTL